ncbi:MAG TPA: PilZ domain-containing protein [Anaeromyxobacter sp.]|nr:PilZ domain-containing protein [Anaeromyxobacter sp.]
MAEFITNPRRAPRAPARCRTAVLAPTGSFEAETEDIGAYGCQVVSPKGVKKDDLVQVTIANDNVPEPLRVGGRIAWVSARFPWRVGIAFDEAALAETTAWFERLVEANPGMRTLRRLPDRIPVETAVYLGQPPRYVLDFNEDEAALLRGIGSGARVDDLMARFRVRGAAIERALFSLIARSAVTLVRGQAVHPSVWKPVLDEVEASLAADSLASGSLPETLVAPPEPPREEPHAPTPVPSAPVAPAATRGAPAPTPRSRPSSIVLPFEPPGASATPVPAAAAPPREPGGEGEPGDGGAGLNIEIEEPTPRATPTPADVGADWDAAALAEGPDGSGKGFGWRKRPRKRPGEAQVLFDRARAEFSAGNVNGAIALLRRALALAPGDPEIAQVLGNLAFRDREPGAR